MKLNSWKRYIPFLKKATCTEIAKSIFNELEEKSPKDNNDWTPLHSVAISGCTGKKISEEANIFKLFAFYLISLRVVCNAFLILLSDENMTKVNL